MGRERGMIRALAFVWWIWAPVSAAGALNVAWTVKVGAASVLSTAASVPTYPYLPDGHLSVLPDGNGGWMLFWSEYVNYRSIGSSPFPETHHLDPGSPVFGGRRD